MKKNSPTLAPVLCNPLSDLAVKSAHNNMTYHASYLLRRAKAKENGLTPLYLRITYNQQRVEVSLNLYVNPRYWDGWRYKCNTKDAKIINETVEINSIRLRQVFNELREKNIQITASLLKDKLLGKEEHYVPVKKKTLADAFERYLKKVELQVKTGNYSPATSQKFQSLLNLLQNFMYLEYRQTDIELEQLNLDFLDNFHSYLLDSKSFKNHRGQLITKRPFKTNYAVKTMRHLKTVINMSIALQWLNFSPFAGFKAKMEKVEQERLTEEEIKAILQKEIHNERLAAIKDFFLFQCFTGLAYIDMQKLTKNDLMPDIEGNKWLSIARQKTKTECRIPLLNVAEDIIKKYSQHPICLHEGKLLPILSNQKYNCYLKELAAICGINKTLTTHVGRRSFASLALNNGVPAETIIKIIGHSNFNALHLYAKHDHRKINSDMQVLRQKFG